MKKIAVLILMLTVITVLSACKKDTSNAVTAGETVETKNVDISGLLGQDKERENVSDIFLDLGMVILDSETEKMTIDENKDNDEVKIETAGEVEGTASDIGITADSDVKAVEDENINNTDVEDSSIEVEVTPEIEDADKNADSNESVINILDDKEDADDVAEISIDDDIENENDDIEKLGDTEYYESWQVEYYLTYTEHEAEFAMLSDSNVVITLHGKENQFFEKGQKYSAHEIMLDKSIKVGKAAYEVEYKDSEIEINEIEKLAAYLLTKDYSSKKTYSDIVKFECNERNGYYLVVNNGSDSQSIVVMQDIGCKTYVAISINTYDCGEAIRVVEKFLLNI